MRRFVPGVDSYLGPGVPALLRFTGPEFGEISLIEERVTTLSDRFRQLCYWRQVVNAENN